MSEEFGSATNTSLESKMHCSMPAHRIVLIAILFVLFLLCTPFMIFAFMPPSIQDAKKFKAQLGSKVIADAVQKYVEYPTNTKREVPRTLDDLVHPPWGGASALKNGKADLIDPWGKPFQMETKKRDNGTEYILVWTTAPDGMPISQFGIGTRTFQPN